MVEITRYTRALAELNDTKFKRLIGIKKHTAARFVEHLDAAYAAKHTRRGRHSKLKPEDMLLMACRYWRQYDTFAEIGYEFGVAESTAHDLIKWVEDVLIKCKELHIPGRKALVNDPDIEVVLVDATESPIERPKRGKKDGIQGRKSDTQ
jgi:hypothetical protein